MINQIIKYSTFSILLIIFSACSSSTETTKHDNVEGKLIETGVASWYGPNFHGRQTANGESYDMYEFTAAHRTLPFNTVLNVRNKINGLSVQVRINDRGPFAKNRIIDLSKSAAAKIKMIGAGTANVEIFLIYSNKPIPQNLINPHYTVQVGSYKTRNDAIRASSSIIDSKIVEASVDGEKYYRIYVGLFVDISEAKELKEELQNRGINGFVKQIQK